MNGMTLPPSPMLSLQAEHERLLARLDETGGAPCPGPAPASVDDLSFDIQALIHEARAYIERARIESEWIVEARDRSQLRANLRFWASFILNCTGTYPDTTLRPARIYRSQFSGLPGTSPVGEETLDPPGWSTENMNSAFVDEAGSTEQDENSEQAINDELQALPFAKPPWYSQISRLMGLGAILIVGVIPLAAVCLALSLFYSLDNQSHFIWSDNFATQTAYVVSNVPGVTPESPVVGTPGSVSSASGLSLGSIFPL